MAALLLASLDQTIVATALPQVVSDLGGLDLYSWAFTAYVLAMTVTRPALRQARRRLRLEAAVRHRDRDLPARFRSLRPRLEHAGADRVPGRPGRRRRRSVRAHARDDRADRPAASARPLAGARRRDVRRRLDRRPGARRRDRRQHELALDLLRQPARRSAGASRDLADDAAPRATAAPLGRLPRGCPARGRDRCADARAELGRPGVRLGLAAGARCVRRLGRAARRLRRRRASRAGADHSRSSSCAGRRWPRASPAWGSPATAMFGVVAFVPLFVQGVLGESATRREPC